MLQKSRWTVEGGGHPIQYSIQYLHVRQRHLTAVGHPVSGSKTIAVRPLWDGNGSRKSGPMTRKYSYGAQPYTVLLGIECESCCLCLVYWFWQEAKDMWGKVGMGLQCPWVRRELLEDVMVHARSRSFQRTIIGWLQWSL